MKNKKTWLAVGAVVLAAALMVGAWFAFGPQATAGEKDIVISVKYADGKTERFEVSTDAEFLKEAAEAKWLSKSELDSIDWLPADVTLIEKIRSLLPL